MRTAGSVVAAVSMGVGLLAAGPSEAAVVASDAAGFSLNIEVPVAAAPDAVFKSFLQIGRWWSDEHTYTGKAANMSLKNEPGGCFCEALAGGGFVRHAVLEYVEPGKAVRLSGALGPLQEMGAHGLWAIQFKGEGSGSRVVMTYNVSGFRPGKGYAELAGPVDQVMTAQLTRLKRFVETGKPST